MTSIVTNRAATAAIQTLRSLEASLTAQQGQVSSGLRIGAARDNAAYWSIATTMRSDTKATAAAADALGLGAAKVDVAYAGLESVVEVLSAFKAKLVYAQEEAVDLSKIQQDLNQLKQQVVSIAGSASFGGENWLSTNIGDMYDKAGSKASVVSSFVRTEGGVRVGRTSVPLLGLSLFNSTGGGILQADPRDMKTIGGLRFELPGEGMSTYSLGSTVGFRPSDFRFDFSSPMTFDLGDRIEFEVVVDAENPADGISAPYHAGEPTSVVIDRDVVNAVLGRSDGTISDYKEYARVLRSVLSGSGMTAVTYTRWDPPGQFDTWVDVPDVVGITHQGIPSLYGSSMEIRNLQVTGVAVGGEISDRSVSYGGRRSSMSLDFQPFTVFEGVVVSMNFRLDDEGYVPLSFDRDYVNGVLGVTDGRVATSDQMATLLAALVGRPEVIVEASSPSTVELRTDPLLDRKSGHRSGIGFHDISVNVEPLPTMNFMDIDVEANPSLVGSYLDYIENVLGRVVSATSVVGALQSRIDAQESFARMMIDNLEKGVSRLVDSDMEASAARLRALQAQQQLALHSLQIANASSEAILQLLN